ncbi:MAG: antibiotic biosynthesis monooxygenase [Steroidobacteraceae bacterium]
MYRLVWEFDAKQERVADFEKVYSPEGRWTTFFKLSPDYLGTELYKSQGNGHRFVTVDTWRSRAAYESFRKANAAEYATLDDWCRQLLSHERMLGVTDDGKS